MGSPKERGRNRKVTDFFELSKKKKRPKNKVFAEYF